MMKNKFLLTLTFLAANAANAFNPQSYLGHLKLGTTTLVVTEVASNLTVPWEITEGPDHWIWYTQHVGTISRLNPDTGENKLVLDVPGVFHKKSLGLLGMAFHPNTEKQPYLFLHYTYRETGDDQSEIIKSRLVRYTYENDKLITPITILDEIPGKSYHNGSRILVTTDNKVFLTTGDAGNPPSSLDPSKLSGKVLRLNLDGSIPSDNPYPNSPVWSIGHRNAQGITLGPNNQLYASEHGPNNDDEINRIQKGHNYGWPNVQGYYDQPSEKEYASTHFVTEPLAAWTPTIAAAGLDYYSQSTIPEWQNSLLLVNMKGRALRVLNLDTNGENIVAEHIYFQKRFGRMRDLCVASNGTIYLGTSNLDWHPRYQPWMYDSLPKGGDRIIQLKVADQAALQQLANLEHPIEITENAEPLSLLSEDWSFKSTSENVSKGEQLYMLHCVACHLPTGAGIPDLNPPLAQTDWVTGDKSRLIQSVLAGLSVKIEVNGKTYEQEMPPFAILSDEDVADILTYIRQAFGNTANAVIPGEVFEERKAVR